MDQFRHCIIFGTNETIKIGNRFMLIEYCKGAHITAYITIIPSFYWVQACIRVFRFQKFWILIVVYSSTVYSNIV